MGGEIERDREALLSGGQIASVKRVGIFRGGEPGVLPDRPGLVDIHGGVGAAQIRRDARPGVEEVDAFEMGFAIAGFYRDAFGREPGLGGAVRFGESGVFKGDLRKVRYAAHGTHHSTYDACGSSPLVMVRMLVDYEPANLLRTVFLRGGLVRKIGDTDYPAEPGFGAELLG